MLNSSVPNAACNGSEISESVKAGDAMGTTLTQEVTAGDSLLEGYRPTTETLATSNDDFFSSEEPGPKPTAAETAVEKAVGGAGKMTLDISEKMRNDLKARLEEEDEKLDADLDNSRRYKMFDEVYDAEFLAGYVPTSRLYETYVKKLDQRAAKRATKRDPAPTMVESFIDYTRVLEARIGLLESKVLDTIDSVEPLEPSEAAEPGDGKKWTDIGLKAKFFHSKTEINQHGNFVAENAQKEGTFTSNIGSKDLIRVLFDWNEDQIQKPSQGTEREEPSPKKIDILAISVASEPIARFFHKRLDLDADDSFLIRFAKPFRPLLRSLQPLRDQLAKLEEQSKTSDKKENGDLHTNYSDPIADARPDRTSNLPDDGLPFPPSSEEDEENTEEFDRPEALEHFRNLLHFIDQYLSKQIDLLTKISAGKEHNIAFEDLWMLFKAGDNIYSHFREGGQVLQNFMEDTSFKTKRRDTPQSYHIVSSAGGVPYAKTFARKSKSILIDLLDNGSFSQSIGTQPLTNQQGILSSERVKTKYIPLYVYCFYIDFDGSKYGMVPEIFIFKPHEGKVDVRSLEAFPLNYLVTSSKDANVDLENFQAQILKDTPVAQSDQTDSLLVRGKKFIDMTAVSHMTYDGLTIGESREEINSAIIVDFKLSFQEYNQQFPESAIPTFSSLTEFWYNVGKECIAEFASVGCTELGCVDVSHIPDQYVVQQKRQREKTEAKVKLLLEEFEIEKSNAEGLDNFKKFMEENDLIKLLPGVVPGFALRNRKWIQADLDLLDPVVAEDGWNDLVLPDGHREMVQAMVETHQEAQGKGCIILLHGAPGVGKTSTAECVASYTKRPLYPITCGDIGYLPDTVETNMEKHFKLAHKWGCVLLLDEADVFLAKRSKDDVKRNGLVSVFLRILEYYSGILFLTTNRVGAIDDAFRSRLHLTLYYPKLNKRQTIAIWKTNLTRLDKINEERQKEGKPLIEFKRVVIIKWVKKNWEVLSWNGRQIRNAFQTALALGEFKARPTTSSPAKLPVIDVKQFKIIATASVQFNEYLQATHGMDEEKTAKRDMLRTELAPAKVKFEGFESSDDSEDSNDDSDNREDSEDGKTQSSDEDSEDSERDEKKKKKKKKSKGKGKVELEDKSRSSKGEKSKDKKKKK